MRFFIEFLKEPQVDFERNLPLDLGQWLSIPFVITGVLFILYPWLLNRIKN
jgi:prolipoprotein diacylglyceryltransferase